MTAKPYIYAQRSKRELEEIAEVILTRFRNRRSGLIVDVEAISEDCGLTILPRRGGLENHVHAYCARDPHFIVIPEADCSYSPVYRGGVAEELCHIILEFELFENKDLPPGARGHELNVGEHRKIETDAKFLSAAILFPKGDFTAQFNIHTKQLTPQHPERAKLLREVLKCLERDFDAYFLRAAHRLVDVGLISEGDLNEHVFNKLVM